MSALYTDIYKTALVATKRIDLAIIGGGCAGLSLARELSERQSSKSVIVIEPRKHYQDDRSWCFWAPRQHAQSNLVSHLWSAWLFGQQGYPNEKRSSSNNPYQYIRSSDFYRKSLETIAQSPTIEIRLDESVESVERVQDGWHIKTDRDHIFASTVIDTRPPAKEQFAHATLYQCFLGVELEHEYEIYNNPSTIELMTEMQVINGDYCFTYLLPFSKNHLLIEQTIFSAQPLTAESLQESLDVLLKNRGLNNASIIRTEYGILPMGLPEDKTDLPRAGMGGGALRPSSGYGFMRIQRWARHCATRFEEQGTVVPQTVSGLLPQKMDQLFLTVLRTQPELAPLLFIQLLGRSNTERFIRFMNDQANVFDYLNIVASLPKTPFIKALLSTLFKPQ